MRTPHGSKPAANRSIKKECSRFRLPQVLYNANQGSPKGDSYLTLPLPLSLPLPLPLPLPFPLPLPASPSPSPFPSPFPSPSASASPSASPSPLPLPLPLPLSLSPFLSVYVSLWVQDKCDIMPFKTSSTDTS